MSILSDVWDGITGAVSDIPKGIVGIGANLYNGYDQRQRQNDLVNAYREREAQNYANSKAEYDYYMNEYLPQYQAAQAASSAAAAAAANANDAARRKAAKKGMKIEKKFFDEAKGNIQPYIDTGHRLLPSVEKTYGNALSGMQLMQGYMNNPQYMQTMNQSRPAYQTNIPLPNWVKGA